MVIDTPSGKHRIGNLNLTDNNVVRVMAVDATGNRLIYEKRVKKLNDECVPSVRQVPTTNPQQIP